MMSFYSFDQLTQLRFAVFDPDTKEAIQPSEWRPRLLQEYKDYYAHKHQRQLGWSLVFSIFAGLIVGISFQLVAPASLLSFGPAVFSLVPASGFLLSLGIMFAPVAIYYFARNNNLRNKLQSHQPVLNGCEMDGAKDMDEEIALLPVHNTESQKMYALIALTNSLFDDDDSLSVENWRDQVAGILGEYNDFEDTLSMVGDFNALHDKMSPKNRAERSQGQNLHLSSPRSATTPFFGSIKGGEDDYFEAHQEKIAQSVDRLNQLILDEVNQPEHYNLSQQLGLDKAWRVFREQRHDSLASIPLKQFKLSCYNNVDNLPGNAGQLLQDIQDGVEAYNTLVETQRYVKLWCKKHELNSEQETVLIKEATNEL